MAVVTLKDVHKSYPMGKQKVEAVKGVSFNIEKGEFAAISGPSGSGKSTILNMMGLIDLPSSGSIIIGGTDVYDGVNLSEAEITNDRWASSGSDKDSKKKKIRTSIPPKLDKRVTALRRSHIGFIFQTFNLIPVLNVYENVEFPLLLNSKNPDSKSPVDDFTKAQKEEWINFLMEKVGLSEWKDHKANELSGGQRQALTLLMATLQKPKVLLLDEHTAALDPKTAAKVLELTQQIVTRDQLTTLMITHNMRDALAFGNRLIMLHNGQVIIDVKGEEKKGLTVRDLLEMFEKAAGADAVSDRMLLG